jgi:hypothetical protein
MTSPANLRAYLFALMCSGALGFLSTAGGAPALPAAGTAEKPVLLLEAEPALDPSASPETGIKAYAGQVLAHEGADDVSAQNDKVAVPHKGLGHWKVTFQWKLDPKAQAGGYHFYACYMCGGDPAVSAQTFTIKAGPDAEHLETRGTFKVTNDTAWKMQWVKGAGAVALKEGDLVVEITNEGRARDVKVFDAFLLSPE